MEVTANPPMMLMKDEHSLTYIPGKPDAAIEMTFVIEEAGRYQINAFMGYGMMSGVYQPFVDDTALPKVLNFTQTGQDSLWTSLDLHDLEPGKHTLKFVGQGPSQAMRTMAIPMYGFGMGDLILLRLEDMQGYRQEMNRVLRERKDPPK
jgi:hypothetical protein